MSPRTDDDAPQAGTTSRREEVLEAAARTFAEKGFSGSTTRQIAERASMLSGSLYYHFPSKEAMALEIVARFMAELFEAYQEVLAQYDDPAEQLGQLYRVSLEVSERRPHDVTILYQDWNALSAIDPTMNATMSRVEGLWIEVITAGVAQGVFRDDVDPRIIYRTLMGTISFASRWYQPGGANSMSEIAGMQASIFLKGLAAS